MSLRVVPVSLDDANEFVRRVHRHHKPIVQALWCIAAAVDDRIVGVATIERPKPRGLGDGWEKIGKRSLPGWTTEVTRCATDGTRNACSLLYGAARRGAMARGFVYGCTYTLVTETGASLRAAGWRRAADVDGREWGCDSRPREAGGEVQCTDKIRWEWGSRTFPGEPDRKLPPVPRVLRDEPAVGPSLFDFLEKAS